MLFSGEREREMSKMSKGGAKIQIRVPSAKYVDAWLQENNHICTRDWPEDDGDDGYAACDCELPRDRELPLNAGDPRMREEDETVRSTVELLRSPQFETYSLLGFRVSILPWGETDEAAAQNLPPIEAVAGTFAEACDRAKELFDKRASRRLRRNKERIVISKVRVLGLVNDFARACLYAKFGHTFHIDTHWGNSEHLGAGECYHVACNMAYDDFLHRLERAQRFAVRDVLHKVHIWRTMRAMRKAQQGKKNHQQARIKGDAENGQSAQ